jgi:DNA mismatch repair ATPase MutS
MAYVENTQQCRFALHSLQILFQSLDGHMNIDSRTIASLEVLLLVPYLIFQLIGERAGW